MFRMLGQRYTEHPLHVRPEDSFHALVAVVLSARTKDPTTNAAMELPCSSLNTVLCGRLEMSKLFAQA